MEEFEYVKGFGLLPHKQATCAAWVWGTDYAEKGIYGAMKIWNSLPERDKEMIRRMVMAIDNAKDESNFLEMDSNVLLNID